MCRPQTRWLCALSVGMRTDAAGGHIDHATTYTYIPHIDEPVPPPSFIFEHFQPDPKWEKLSQLDFSRVLAFARAAAPVLLFNTSLIRWNGCRSPHHHYHHQHHSTANNATDVSYFSLTFLFYRCSLLILSTRWHFFLEKEKTRKYLLKKDIFRHTCVCVVNVVTYNVCCLHRQLDVHFIDILFNDFG